MVHRTTDGIAAACFRPSSDSSTSMLAPKGAGEVVSMNIPPRLMSRHIASMRGPSPIRNAIESSMGLRGCLR
ncbi:hypothetical protein BE04_05480 [Sorangium cellulosum]|uniref:Uncharacterized protein n=1 Tax=Sorangium cellulosum TaxID=56 RepID=A0A150PMA8_SORCE|nr:hypothetical protein BE04_05480 [Sorangium cellulosum]